MNNNFTIKQRIFQKVTIDQIILPEIMGYEYWIVDNQNFETSVIKVRLLMKLIDCQLENMLGKDIYYKHEKYEVFAKIKNIEVSNDYVEIEIYDFDCQ